MAYKPGANGGDGSVTSDASPDNSCAPPFIKRTSTNLYARRLAVRRLAAGKCGVERSHSKSPLAAREFSFRFGQAFQSADIAVIYRVLKCADTAQEMRDDFGTQVYYLFAEVSQEIDYGRLEYINCAVGQTPGRVRHLFVEGDDDAAAVLFDDSARLRRVCFERHHRNGNARRPASVACHEGVHVESAQVVRMRDDEGRLSEESFVTQHGSPSAQNNVFMDERDAVAPCGLRYE